MPSSSHLGAFSITPTHNIQAWDCIWAELIQNGKGLKTVYDRPGFVESDYDFSVEMLDKMLEQLDYTLDKYSSPEWNTKDTANRIVDLLTEHRQLVQTERNQAAAGGGGRNRNLKDSDFLGPAERARRRELQRQQDPNAAKEKKDHSQYFKSIEAKLLEKKRRDMREMARKVAADNKVEAEKQAKLKVAVDAPYISNTL